MLLFNKSKTGLNPLWVDKANLLSRTDIVQGAA
jgi:hypothetical protein